MSLDAFLNESGVITREMPVGTDRYNNAETLPRVVATARCRKTQKTMRVLSEVTAEYTYIHADLLLFQAGVDVLPGDVVTVSGQAWRVVSPVLKRMRANEQHHVSAIVEAVNG